MTCAVVSQRDVPPYDDENLLAWLEKQPNQLQAKLTQEIIADLLEELRSSKHDSGDICMKVCHLINQFMRSKISSIQKCVYTDLVCLELFNFFLEFNDKNLGRSMRRALEQVSKLIACNPNKLVVASVKTAILHKTLSIVRHQSVKPLVKPALRSLEYLLGKSSISINDFLEILETSSEYKVSKFTSKSEIYEALWDSFVIEIFELMLLPEISQIASKLLITICHQTKKAGNVPPDFGNRISSWELWIQQALERNPDLLESIRNYLLPSLFNHDKPVSLIFLDKICKELLHSQYCNKKLDAKVLLGLAALEIGKRKGLIEEQATFQFLKPQKKISGAVIIKDGLMEPFLAHSSAIVRLLSFSVLVSSPSPLRPLNLDTIRQIKTKLYIFYSETDVKSRNDILSITKNLIERLRGSTAFLVKEINTIKSQRDHCHNSNELKEPKSQDLLEKAENLLRQQILFIAWFFRFLVEELAPTASYQRHVASLKAITLWISSGIIQETGNLSRVKSANHEIIWPCHIDFFIPETIRLLMDLLVNPYEDVRALSSGILKMSSPCHIMRIGCSVPLKSDICEFVPVLNFDSDEPLRFLENFVKHVEEISDKTGRADYADGLARSYELLYCLQRCHQDQAKILTNLLTKLYSKISFAKQNLGQAVQEAPLHGILASINLIWGIMEEKILSSDFFFEKQWLSNFQENSTEICSQIWSTIGPILCNDSPEGYLLDEVEESSTADTKGILSYSFRAIHESSNLMRTFISKNLNFPASTAQLSKNTFLKISNLSFEMLSSLRHRGALSTVSLTFSSCCKLAPYFSSNILETWLEGAFSRLNTQVSTTRRSAGIPLIITAIMSAMPTDDFERTMKELLKTAEIEVKSESNQEQLPQVHALNSLKEIVKSVITNMKVDAYIPQCFEVVGQCLGSSIWAIRNSALILLRGLIDNLIGTSGNMETENGWDGKSVKIQYKKYPALTRILIQLLKYDSSQVSCEEIKNETVLPALSIIRRAGPPIEYHDSFYKLIYKILGNKSWYLREQAARTISVLISRGSELEIIRNLIEQPGETTNERHGSILAAKFIILDPANVSRWELSQLDYLYHLLLKLEYQNSNHFILSECIDLQNETLMLIQAHPDFKERDRKNEYFRQKLKIGQDFCRSNNPKDNSIKIASGSRPGFQLYLRRCLSREMSNSIIVGDRPAIIKTIERAKYLGADTLIAVLDQILPIFKLNVSEAAFDGIISALIKILETTEESAAVSVSLNTMAQILRVATMFSHTFPGLAQDLKTKLNSFFALNTNIRPKLISSCYEISGFIISYQHSLPFISKEPRDNFIDDWVQILKNASRASQEFDLRYAAAASIKDFYMYSSLKNGFPNYKSNYPELNLIMVTLLEDDDEDIRALVSSVVSNLLGYSMCPLAAMDAIFKHQFTSAHQYDHFGWSCIHNLVIFDYSHSRTNPVDPAQALQRATTIDHSLFVIEEPNLFSDPCRKIDYFGKAFLEFEFRSEIQLQHQESGTRSELTTLLEWASCGILELQRRYPLKRDTNVAILTHSFTISLTPVFIVIRRIITCTKIALAYWKKNSHLIYKFGASCVEGKILVESWEIRVQKLEQDLPQNEVYHIKFEVNIKRGPLSEYLHAHHY